MADDWDELRIRIRDALGALADREFVTVGEPAAAPGPPRGLLRRRARPAPTRYVQFLRVGEALEAECAGSTSFGGDLPLSAEVEDRLRALGWLAPGDTTETDWGYPNYHLHATVSESERLAALSVESLAVLGLEPGQTSSCG